MIVVVKPECSPADLEQLKSALENQGVSIHLSRGQYQTVLGLVGDTTGINAEALQASPLVEKLIRVQEPYKKANRLFHPENTEIAVGEPPAQQRIIGGRHLGVIAGPCSVESRDQVLTIAREIKKAGAGILRGGVFKPRTSPYSFQGMGIQGLQFLLEAKKETGLPIVTELMAIQQLEAFDEVDIIQVGARNMQNFSLLKELGRCRKPILLKRGPASTVTELLMAAEYIMAGGNSRIILCERGIRSFESGTRNTLDLSAVPMLKKHTHLPVIVDPSHATGLGWMVPAMSKAAVAAGADGLLVEVHNNPQAALCDGEQAITPGEFSRLMETLAEYGKIEGRILS